MISTAELRSKSVEGKSKVGAVTDCSSTVFPSHQQDDIALEISWSEGIHMWISVQGLSRKRHSQGRHESQWEHDGYVQKDVAEETKQVGKQQEEKDPDHMGLCSHRKDSGFHSEGNRSYGKAGSEQWYDVLFHFFFNVYLWGRDRAWEGERQRKRETQNLKQAPGSELSAQSLIRSEERRVGKECASMCRSRWSPYH